MTASAPRLRPTTDLTAAAWLEAEVSESGPVVASLLPRRFPAYARILHPAESPEEEPVRWDAVAAWSGGVIHPRVQFAPLARHRPGGAAGPPPWDEPPAEGELAAGLLTALTGVLARHTGTPRTCWFGLWEGWGWIEGGPSTATVRASSGPDDTVPVRAGRPLPPAFPPEVIDGPRVRLPGRAYLLFTGPAEAAADLGDRSAGFFIPQSPNVFWPDDRAWCAATEIDLDGTYVGGSESLIAGLLADPRLETVTATPDDPIDGSGDSVNDRR